MVNWNDLPDEMKEMVVKEMGVITRLRLKMCSKKDKRLVESLAIPCEYMQANVSTSSIDISIRQKPKNIMMLRINQMGYQVIVDRDIFDPEGGRKVITCEDYHEAEKMMKQMFASIVFNSGFRYESANVELNCPRFLTKADKFTVFARRTSIEGAEDQTIEWLENMAPGVKNVKVAMRYYNDLMEIRGIGAILAVKNALELEIHPDCDINDDQLAKFNCTSLKIHHNSNITGKGINQLIKKALAGDYPKGTHIEIGVNHRELFQMWEDINKGLTIQITQSYNNTGEYGQPVFGARAGRIGMTEKRRMEISLKKEGFLMDIPV